MGHHGLEVGRGRKTVTIEHRPRAEAPAGRAEPGPAPRRSRPRAGGPGDPREGEAGHQGAARRRTSTIAVPLIETARAHQGGGGRHPRAERPLPDRDAGRQVHRRVPQGGRQGRAEVHRRGPEDHRLAGRLRRHQRVPADGVRAGLRRGPRLPRDSVQHVAPEDVLVVARARPRGAVLGPEVRAVALGCEGDLHHRERLRGGRRAGRRRQRLRHRPRHVPARTT